MTTADLNLTTELAHELARERRDAALTVRERAAADFAREVAEGRAGYGNMLARVWKEANRLLRTVEDAPNMAPKDRVMVLRELGKLMPQLERAEAAYAQKGAGSVPVRDMSDRQLDRELKRARREKKSARGGGTRVCPPR